MKISDFFAHHGINRNPFAEEDAQSDIVFQSGCINTARHPGWDKIFGDPDLPSTSVVFGEKGSGKTALRIQMTRALDQYNQAHPQGKVFIIQYNDFNPFLDGFQERFSGMWKKPESFLKRWKLWDHIDAILSLGVTQLTDQVLQIRDSSGNIPPELNLQKLDENQRRDLLLLAALYDQSSSGGQFSRWKQLKRKLGVFSLAIWKWLSVAAAWFLLFLGIAIGTWHLEWHNGGMLWRIEFWLFLLVGTIPLAYRQLWAKWKAWVLWRNLRSRRFEKDPLKKILLNFTPGQLANQPLPTSARSDDRYALLGKFSELIQILGYKGMVILVDRVDEPYLINGAAPLMRDLIWPLLDNKLLKYPNIGFKLLLPAELYDFVSREGNEFRERSRLDKQNMIPSLNWTGASLYDMVNSRLAACSDASYTQKEPETLEQLFDSSMSREHLTDSLERIRTPRRVFKFLYELLVEHSNSHTEQNPQWQISTNEFDNTLKHFLKNEL